MDSLYDKKLKELALQLKENCSENGTERNEIKSAKIFHQIGLLYFEKSKEDCQSRNTDKSMNQTQKDWDQPGKTEISLVKSVGLLNSALIRLRFAICENESTLKKETIYKDLSHVYQYILEQAYSQISSGPQSSHFTNKIDKLIQTSKQIKFQVKTLRKDTKNKLQTGNENFRVSMKAQALQASNIKLMQEIQQYITNQYIKIMQNICQCCLEILGPAPCAFAVVGMGSLARKEITPYSDFEHIILLEEHEKWESNLPYFRWYSVIFHTVILNLQETIIRRLNIKYLNDPTTELGDWFCDAYTPSGISFDSLMPFACKIP